MVDLGSRAFPSWLEDVARRPTGAGIVRTVRKVLVMLTLTVAIAIGLFMYGVLDWKFGGWVAALSLFAILALRFFVPGGWIDGDDLDIDL
jgi:hypothetical protein